MDTIAQLFERFGVAIVFVNTLLHELGLPIPLTPTVLVAGAAAAADVPPPPELPADVRREIIDASKLVPVAFRTAYVNPLLNELDSRDLQDPVTLETLAGAVFDHNPRFGVSQQLHQFLAVRS